MQPQDANHRYSFRDPTWQLWIELSLPFSDPISEGSSFLLLIEAIRALGLRQAQFERMQADIIRAVDHAIERSARVDPALSIIVRLFVNNRGIERIHQAKNNASGDPGQDQRVSSSSLGEWTEKEDGWGYFLSERSLDQTAAGLKRRLNLIELFLYREGR